MFSVFSTIQELGLNTLYIEYVDKKCGVEHISSDDTDVNSQRVLEYTRVVVSGWMTLFTTILGVLGNLLSIMTLLDRWYSQWHNVARYPSYLRSMTSNVFNKLLVTLCCADLLVLLTNSVTVLKIFFPHSPDLVSVAPWTDSVCHMAVSASVFLMVSISLERHYAVCYPQEFQSRPIRFGPLDWELCRIDSLDHLSIQTEQYLHPPVLSGASPRGGGHSQYPKVSLPCRLSKVDRPTSHHPIRNNLPGEKVAKYDFAEKKRTDLRQFLLFNFLLF